MVTVLLGRIQNSAYRFTWLNDHTGLTKALQGYILSTEYDCLSMPQVDGFSGKSNTRVGGKGLKIIRHH